MASVLLVQSDTKPFLTFSFAGGDLDDYASIVLVLQRPDGTTITRDAVIDDPENGHFEWQEGDIQTGISLAEIRFTDNSGGVMTIPAINPIKIESRGRLG